MTLFVNPYNFVPLAADVNSRRERPAGHERYLSDRLTGRLDVTFTATTPVSVGAVKSDGALPTEVTGSMIRGALRSAHEALTGSCLRVFDTDFIPAYREGMASAAGRQMGVVAEVAHDRDGMVESLSLFVAPPHEVVDVPWRLLADAAGGDRWGARTGQRLDITDEHSVHRQGVGIVRIADGASFQTDGPFVLLVTNTSARQGGTDHWRFRAVRAPVNLSPAAGFEGGRVWVSAEVVRKFNQAVEGVRDRRTSPGWLQPREDEHGWTFAATGDSHFNEGGAGQKFGFRLVPLGPGRAALRKGQPVFVSMAGDDVTWVGLSHIWRRAGAIATGERVGDAGPCTDVSKLCPSCRVLGSADTSGRKDDEHAVQNSYAGHVRTGSVTVTHPAGKLPFTITLPRVDRPRPGAGQFYLTDTTVMAPDGGSLPLNPAPAAREWGSMHDYNADGSAKHRSIRGRKFYRTSTWAARRAQLDGLQEADGTTQRACLPEETTLSTSVTFGNLTREELGALICVIAPDLWLEAWRERPGHLDSHKARFRLGGGKPQGLGALTSSLTVTLTDPRTGWLGASAETSAETDSGSIVASAVRAYVDAAAPEVKDTWAALAAMIVTDIVDPAQIRYPVAGTDPFPFWKGSVGSRRRRKVNGVSITSVTPLIVLPDPAGPAAHQVLNTDAAVEVNL